jgi:hypothetical protein
VVFEEVADAFGCYPLLKDLPKVGEEYNSIACCYSIRKSLSILGALEFLEWPKGHELIVFVNLWVLYVVGAVKMASLCPTSGRLFVSGSYFGLVG